MFCLLSHFDFVLLIPLLPHFLYFPFCSPFFSMHGSILKSSVNQYSQFIWPFALHFIYPAKPPLCADIIVINDAGAGWSEGSSPAM